ncbi:DEAD/DEAH box helicase family protein [Intestinibacter bartlettii]|uniref:DEAD/DEAH box helicase family protein n=1 Tax=Intestinibacter bartlettii TaxID=261299 RepID=A0ABS6DYG6_9FIRM|nr:DEAD/DEAH box helicase family protein [Intestinibacter bartlettii]
MVLNINCITGGNDYLYKHIQQSLHRAKSIDIIVSFLMESGVKLLKDDLKEIQGIPIRILTGNYLNITQPSALYLLKELIGKDLDLRFYNDKSVSFHPKAYIFNYEDGGEIFIGSSNLSQSAWTKGIEWNYRIDKNSNLEDFNYFKEQFEDMFNNNSIIVNDQELEAYSKSWRKPRLPSNQYEKFTPHTNLYDDKKVFDLFEPRGAQIEALYNLKKTRLEGNKKGLVVAATGIGKTYLAAFDSRNFNRILFIAHREEILLQAYESFKNIRTDKIITIQNKEVIDNTNIYANIAEPKEGLKENDYEINMGFFMGNRKEKNKDIIFASVQTLGKQEYLNKNYFDEDYFDYIVVDEFHHAVTNNYQNILNYFKPKFLLGLTATPYRLDNRDVFSICDNNLVYEVDLNSTINKGWLVPFRYYGIYDDSIDYEGLTIRSGIYDEKELEKALSINKRADLVLKHYKRYKSKTAIGFCTSKSHASYMAKYFNERGVNSVAVYSGNIDEHGADRKEVISKLKSGEIKVIFCVDMFNEGVDIKDIDLVMFLRPTESQTVFLQQLGRGLRISKNKKYLNVLDFIGNYKKAYLKPYFLAGKTEEEGGDLDNIMNDENYPEDCLVNFDFRIIDLFEYMKYGPKGKDSVEKEEEIKLSFALRDEKVNFFSMVEGTDYLKYKYEIMLCKKQKLPSRPYLLDVKKSNSVFALSEEGKVYQNQIKDRDLPLKYVAFIDSYIKVKVDKVLFENLYNNGLFSTWIPEGPMKYFKDCEEGYITLFRVYELKAEVNERLLERGRRGRNSFFGLSEDVDLDIVRPVLSDEGFNKIKSDILKVIRKSRFFIENRYNN